MQDKQAVYVQRRRIMTPEERQAHIDGLVGYSSSEGKELVGDLATFNSNRQHNPKTGFDEWLPDTPRWIRRLGIRRAWASEDAEIEMKEKSVTPMNALFEGKPSTAEERWRVARRKNFWVVRFEPLNHPELWRDIKEFPTQQEAIKYVKSC
jgi:hypothetical protein